MHLDVTPNREYRSYEDVGLYVRSCSVQKSVLLISCLDSRA